MAEPALAAPGGATLALTRDEDGASRLAEALAARLEPGDLVTLRGEIGAGKSHLARAIIRAVADDARLDVPSPTFTLVQSYDDLRLPVWHADLYRLGSPDEAAEIGLETALDEGALLVEWPERGEGALPFAEAVLDILITGEGEARAYRLTGTGGWSARLDRLSETDDFLLRSDWHAARRAHVVGDASTRRYERLGREGETVLLMDAPVAFDRVARSSDGAARSAGQGQGEGQGQGVPPRAGTSAYARTVGLAADIKPFLVLAQTLRAKGFPAPRLPAFDADAQLCLVEDFGREGIAAKGRAVPERYEAALDLLAALHGEAWPERLEASGLAHDLPAYGAAAMRAELAQYPRCFDTGVDEAAFLAAWDGVLAPTLATAPTLVLRDHHSPNVMWRGGADWRRSLGLLDFQDACLGPAAYDVASLVQDARVDLDDGLEEALTARYLAARPHVDAAAFRHDVAVLGAQRASKVLGAFRRLAASGKPGYLAHIPRVTAALTRNLAHPALEPVRGFYTGLDVSPDTLSETS